MTAVAARIATAHAPDVVHTDEGETCTVVFDTVDAIAVGQSLRMLARDPRTPHGTREIFARVGQQMVSAAHVVITQRPSKGGRR